MLDRNNDGSIQPDEVLAVFQGNDMFNIDMAKKIISELDCNRDGKIEYSEFEKFMKDGDNFVLLNEEDETSAQMENWSFPFFLRVKNLNTKDSKQLIWFFMKFVF